MDAMVPVGLQATLPLPSLALFLVEELQWQPQVDADLGGTYGPAIPKEREHSTPNQQPGKRVVREVHSWHPAEGVNRKEDTCAVQQCSAPRVQVPEHPKATQLRHAGLEPPRIRIHWSCGRLP